METPVKNPSPASWETERLTCFASALTLPGMIRLSNEDNFGLAVENTIQTSSGINVTQESQELIKKGYQLLLVADGMGGELAGDIASRMAIKQIFINLNQELSLSSTEIESAISKAVNKASQKIFTYSQQAERKGMGTTIVGILIARNVAYIFHAGDSRAYLIRNQEIKTPQAQRLAVSSYGAVPPRLNRDGASSPSTEVQGIRLAAGVIKQLTKDQNAAQVFIDRQREKGELTPNQEERIRHSQLANALTNHLGVKELKVVVSTLEIKAGDIFLLSSDGLTGIVEDEEIKKILTENADLNEAIKALVNLANFQGGPDNITAAACQVR